MEEIINMANKIYKVKLIHQVTDKIVSKDKNLITGKNQEK